MKIKCTACRKESRVEPKRRGNTAAEVILWLVYVVPGIIYSIWRNTGKVYECPFCTSRIVEKLEAEGKDESNIVAIWLAVFFFVAFIGYLICSQ